MAGQKPPDKTLYPYNTHIWQPSWCCSTLSIMSLNWYKCYILSCYVTTDYLVFTCVHSFLYFPVFPGISHLGVLDRGYHWTGRYFPGITALVFPVYISQPMFALILVLVLGVSVLDVLEYLIGGNAKYLYLITSTWSIWVLDQLYLTPTLFSRAPRFSPTLPLLKQLHWLPGNYRIKFKLSTLTYRALAIHQRSTTLSG